MEEELRNLHETIDEKKYLDILESYERPETSFHSIGIHDPKLLLEITDKPSCHIQDGVPLFVDINEVDSIVDVERCRRIASRLTVDDTAQISQINLSLVPLDHIVINPQFFELHNSLLIAEYQDDGRREKLSAEAKANGIEFLSFVHPETGTEASMKLFEFTARAKEVDQEPASLNQALAQGRVVDNERLEDGGSLRIARGGSFDPEEQKQLWNLFSTRFQDISQNMPIRLEETEESTQELLDDPNYTFIYKVEPTGNISCCVFASDQQDAYPWINRAFSEHANQEDKNKYGKQPYEIFVPGVAAYKQEGIKASTPVIQKFADLIASTGQELFAIRAECTDVSALYVPDLVMKNLDTNEHFKTAELKDLGEKKMAMVRLKANQER